MSDNGSSSRARYGQYRQAIKDRTKQKPEGADAKKDEKWVRNDPRRRQQRQRSFFRLYQQFWGLLAGHRKILILSMLTLGASTLIGLLPMYGTKLVIDNVLDDKPRPAEIPSWIHLPTDPHTLLRVIGLTMITIAVVSLILTTWSRWQATRVTKRVVVSARRKAFEHAVRLPLHRVYELKSGGVASILRDDAGGVGELVFSLLYNPWRAVVQLCGTLFILASVDWRLLLGAIVLLPTVWFTHRTWISRIRPLWRDIRSTRQEVDGHSTETFGGMRVVRSFGRQRTEAASFTTGNHLMARQEIYAWWWMRGIDAAWSILIPLATALLLWYGGGRVLEDMARVRAGIIPQEQALTAGDLVIFMGYLTMLLGPIASLAQSATGLQNNLAGLDRTLDLLDEPIEMVPNEDSIKVEKGHVRGQVAIHDLAFRYAGAKEAVLEDINLEVEPGEMVALVGPSGAGKTTLCNLIARFYDPTEGSIKLDGVDLRDIDVDSYRRLLGIVEQDTFLFDGTIADNIAYGSRHATMEQIVDAAKKANAHSFITTLDDGYDTLIGERGVKLSGGQRQRLTIARAILADPKILILDEATSNLDTESERLIQHSLQTLMRDRTSFVIAHRLSTIIGADRIVVIEKGRIVETGTHDELISRSGKYQRMVELQTRPPEGQAPEQEQEPQDVGAR